MSNEVKLNVSQSRGYENANLELIKVTTNKEGQKLVSARELHELLVISEGKQERFSQWFNRHLQYGFEENVDFTSVKVFTVVNNGAKRELDDYAMTIDMAKELAMLQKSEKGRKVRQYFIECEKVAHNPYAHLSKELQMMIKLEQGQTQLDQRLMKLENNMTIDYGQQLEIQNAVSRAAIKALGGYDSYAYRTKTVNRKTFNAIYKMLKTTFQVNSYKNISTKNFEVAKELIATWKPNEDLVLMIRGANAQMLLGDVI